MVNMMRTRPICSTVLIALMLAVCGIPAERPASAPPPEPAQTKSTGQLRAQVDKLLATGDPALIRRSIADVFTLVNRLVKAGRQKEAFPYLSAALKYYPWALDYQLTYAEMLRSQGQTDLARERAELVLRYAEQDAQVSRARKLLQKEALPALPRMGNIPADTTTVVVVPIGEVDTCVLEDLRADLQTRLGIPVLVQDARVRAPRPKRDPLTDYLAKARETLEEKMENQWFADYLKSKGISRDDLAQDAGVVKAFREVIFSASDTQGLAKFDATLEQLRQAEKQWDIEDLLNSLRVAVRSFRQERVYFLGLANLDVFAGQSAFTFGTAGTSGQCAVVSYRRFTSAFNRDGPDRRRLLERTIKQSLSSLGFLWGVGMCSNPACARAYSRDLAEHDAKSIRLCSVCQTAFERVPGIILQQDDQERQSGQEQPSGQE